MAKYRLKSFEVEAIQWLGQENFDELYEFANADNSLGIVGMKDGSGDIAQVRTKDGMQNVLPGDYIVKDEQNRLHYFNQPLFKMLYDTGE